MSRAFVKEAEDKVEDLPDRPISGHRNLVTPEGLAAIEAALIRFENAQREAIVKNDALASAAAMREVRYWRARRASAEVVRPRAKPDTASFGTTVTLRRNDGREQTFRIVGEDEADPSHGTVSYIYVEARPKGRPEGSAVDDIVVEDHADHVLATFKTQKKRSIGRGRTTMRRSSLACGT
jgi:transcription elongation GreA/GreB family factor